MRCERLQDVINASVDSMKKENAPFFLIEETVWDMWSGDASVCGGCEDYEECFGRTGLRQGRRGGGEVSISCDCSAEGYDGPEVFREEYPTARKSYKCCECGGEIRPEQKYHKETGLWEGGWETHRTCEPCMAIREKYCPRGWIYGELREVISECLGFDYTEVPEGEDDD